MQRKCAPVADCNDVDVDVDNNADAKTVSEKERVQDRDNTIYYNTKAKFVTNAHYVCAENMSHPDPVV